MLFSSIVSRITLLFQESPVPESKGTALQIGEYGNDAGARTMDLEMIYNSLDLLQLSLVPSFTVLAQKNRSTQCSLNIRCPSTTCLEDCVHVPSWNFMPGHYKAIRLNPIKIASPEKFSWIKNEDSWTPGSVVRRVDITIRWINPYPVDKFIG